MQNFRSKLPAFLVIVWVYLNVIISPSNIGGDLAYQAPADVIINYGTFPTVWFNHLNNGFGGFASFPLVWSIWEWGFAKIAQLTNNLWLINKLRLLIPIILAFYSISIFLDSRIHRPAAKALATIVFLCNPYIVLLISGGQLGMAKAYAVFPLCLHFFFQWLTVRAQTSKTAHYYETFKLLLSLLLLLIVDGRVFLISLPLLVIIALFKVLLSSQRRYFVQQTVLYSVFIAGAIILTNMHIILTTVNSNSLGVPLHLASVTEVTEYFSFTRFAHALTLTHPNYPENIFGKVTEVNGLAFLLPILAFAAIKLKPSRQVICFTMLAITSAFLAKGANEPFGLAYQWFFQYVPGGNLFRDSTKFFIPLSLSYTYLIAITIENVQTLIAERHKSTNMQIWNFFVICIPCIVMLSIWFPTFSHHIRGTLAYQAYPAAYTELAEILTNDQNFGRVVWVPSQEAPGYRSTVHPNSNLNELVREPYCISTLCRAFSPISPNEQFTRSMLSQEITQEMNLFTHALNSELFQKLAINYVVLTPDYAQRQYLFNYQSDRSIYEEYRQYLDTSTFLRRVYQEGELILYTTVNQGSLLSDAQTDKPISYSSTHPSQYTFTWSGGEGSVHMSQRYDPRWVLQSTTGEVVANAQPTAEQTMHFNLPNQQGEYKLLFTPQTDTNVGWIISLSSWFLLLIASIYIFLNKHVGNPSRSTRV